jgi:hypothetical protein
LHLFVISLHFQSSSIIFTFVDLVLDFPFTSIPTAQHPRTVVSTISASQHPIIPSSNHPSIQDILLAFRSFEIHDL